MTQDPGSGADGTGDGVRPAEPRLGAAAYPGGGPAYPPPGYPNRPAYANPAYPGAPYAGAPYAGAPYAGAPYAGAPYPAAPAYPAAAPYPAAPPYAAQPPYPAPPYAAAPFGPQPYQVPIPPAPTPGGPTSPAYAGYPPAFTIAGPAFPVYYVPVPAGPAPGLAWAGYLSRLGAFLLDCAVLFALLFGFGVVSGIVEAVFYPGSAGLSRETTNAVTAFWYLLVFLYMPVWWGWKGATPGQIALRETIRQQENGRPIGWVTAIVRYAGLLLTFGSCLLVVGLILVPLTIAGEPRRRMWHDRLADTVVVRAL